MTADAESTSSASSASSASSSSSPKRFTWLWRALILLLLAYPYYPENDLGSLAGGLTSLFVLVAALGAVQRRRRALAVGITLAIAATTVDIASYFASWSDAYVEIAFALFYAWATLAIVAEVFRDERVTFDTVRGATAVYVLIGLTFASLYDFVESVQPGSFQLNVDVAADVVIGWRQLVFYSFMTLTTIGYGDITPATTQAQSLAIVEGVIGVLFVAVFIGRTLGLFSRHQELGGP